MSDQYPPPSQPPGPYGDQPPSGQPQQPGPYGNPQQSGPYGEPQQSGGPYGGQPQPQPQSQAQPQPGGPQQFGDQTHLAPPPNPATNPYAADPDQPAEVAERIDPPEGTTVNAAGGVTPRIDVKEKAAFAMNGFLAWVFIALLWVVGIGWGIFTVVNDGFPAPSIVIILVALLLGSSVTVIQPGQAKVLQFFGRYVGTVRRQGLVLTVPWTSKKSMSTKVENFETNELKVNDADGNPVNIAAIVVWQVADTAKASFAVEEYHRFVTIQAEAALRHVASQYPYDNAAEGEPTLREATDVVAARIAEEVNARVHLAGVTVIETRISTLAYAPEIAQAMLQRQQASAIIAAREKILDGAVGMVNGALRQLETTVPMDDAHKAEMVSNLLVVLTSESRVTPVINTSMPRERDNN
ncbi:SPFH domain-containing protein [Propionibacteriaceae bacterium Y2011]